MKIKILLCAIVLFGSLHGKEFCFFSPPPGWIPADPKSVSSLVKIGFLDPKSRGFRSSINLAEEPIDCSLEEYLEAVKKIHTNQRRHEWSYLGTFATKLGEGALTQIDMPTSWGIIRLLQLIVVRNSKAYILTAATDKKHFLQFMQPFKEAFASLCLTEDLFSSIADESKKNELLHLQQQALLGNPEAFKLFQKEILALKNTPGPHWQALLLAEVTKNLPR